MIEHTSTRREKRLNHSDANVNGCALILLWMFVAWSVAGVISVMLRLDSSAPINEAALAGLTGILIGFLLGVAHYVYRETRVIRRATATKRGDDGKEETHEV